MSRLCRFFVYGTLKRGERREHAWPHAPLSITVATIKGRLFDLGSYPALIMGEEIVEGEIWLVAEEHLEDTLATLDAIEGFVPDRDGNLYERQVVECAVDSGQSQQAWTYFYAQPLPHEGWIKANTESGRVNWAAS